MQAVLKAQINKTDRNDARGIAQMMRVGLYRPVHVKTLRSQKLRMLLTHRKLLQSKAIAIENDLRGTLRNFGLKVGMVGKVKFEARIKELVENLPDLAALVEPLGYAGHVTAPVHARASSGAQSSFVLSHGRLLRVGRLCIRHRVVVTHHVQPLPSARDADENLVLQFKGSLGSFDLLKSQLATAEVAMRRGRRLNEGAHIISFRSTCFAARERGARKGPD